MTSLAGKTAVITGANRGIGLATVEVLAENGAAIWACARSHSGEFENRLKEVADKSSVVIRPIYFDVTDEMAVKEAIRIIGKDSKSIDILVNNAGISVESLFNMTSLKTMRKCMEVNFLSQINIAQLVSRYMIKNKMGSIVNIASVSGMVSEEGGVAYGSSKAAIIFATRIMALELGIHGIRVNSISPGFIDTDMWKNRKEEVVDKILRETPLRRQGTPMEVAQVILFLVSDMASYITGQNLVVDGGRKMARDNSDISNSFLKILGEE